MRSVKSYLTKRQILRLKGIREKYYSERAQNKRVQTWHVVSYNCFYEATQTNNVENVMLQSTHEDGD